MTSKIYEVYTTIEIECYDQIEAESALEARKKVKRFYENLDEIPGEIRFDVMECNAYEPEDSK